MSFKEYQPLRVFPDWKITWNCFFKDEVIKNRAHLAGNLLFAISENRKRYLELVYKPEDTPDGEFILSVINLQEEFIEASKSVELTGDWTNPHFIFTSKNHAEIVSKIEELFFSLNTYEDERIFKSKGVIDEVLENLRLEFLEKGYSKKKAQRLIKSNNVILQNLLLDTKEVCKSDVLFLSENGIIKGIKNKAKQKLNSKKYR